MKRLYNPMLEDFKRIWFDDNNNGHELTLKSLAFTELPDSQAQFMAKHLTDKLIFSRGVKQNPDLDREEIQKEIFL